MTLHDLLTALANPSNWKHSPEGTSIWRGDCEPWKEAAEMLTHEIKIGTPNKVAFVVTSAQGLAIEMAIHEAQQNPGQPVAVAGLLDTITIDDSALMGKAQGARRK